MPRKEMLLASLKEIMPLIEELEHRGDFDAHASVIRTLAKIQCMILTLMLEQEK